MSHGVDGYDDGQWCRSRIVAALLLGAPGAARRLDTRRGVHQSCTLGGGEAALDGYFDAIGGTARLANLRSTSPRVAKGTLHIATCSRGAMILPDSVSRSNVESFVPRSSTDWRQGALDKQPEPDEPTLARPSRTSINVDQPRRRLSTWTATAMVVTQVIGVGIFLTPATMMQTLGGLDAALAVWAVMGLLSIAGALCYAELTTRFPQAGGGYVFLREAFGPRTAFVFGWMALLVMDPGITAALGIGLAQYLLAAVNAGDTPAAPVAIALVAGFGVLTVAGVGTSAALLRWTAAAKLAIVAVLVGAGILRSGAAVDAIAAGPAPGQGMIGLDALAGATIAAFFAFGGWWELGRMSEEVDAPRRTMPRALIGGVALVTAIYALITVAYVLGTGGRTGTGSDEAFVAVVGAALFGERAARLLAAMVVIAVSGSLAATLLAAPRMYVAMARDGIFPSALARFDRRRGAIPRATLIQVSLASVLIMLGTFEQVLGYFVPVTVFFLGLSAAAMLRLPRPAADEHVFRSPLHPLPIVLFLALIVGIVVLFVVGQPRETLLGAAIAALGIPVSLVLRRRA